MNNFLPKIVNYLFGSFFGWHYSAKREELLVSRGGNAVDNVEDHIMFGCYTREEQVAEIESRGLCCKPPKHTARLIGQLWQFVKNYLFFVFVCRRRSAWLL